jgi:hypothetical protein
MIHWIGIVMLIAVVSQTILAALLEMASTRMSDIPVSFSGDSARWFFAFVLSAMARDEHRILLVGIE